MDDSLFRVVVAITIILAFLSTVFFSRDLTRWLKLKKFRYDATFALTMMNPRERFVCNSIVFLTLSMLIIAACLYLPEHIVTMTHRAFYYWSGKTKSNVTLSEAAASTAKVLGAQASNAARAAVNMAKRSMVDTPVGGPTPIEAVPVQGMGL